MFYLLSLFVVLHQISGETFVKQVGTGRCVWCVDRDCIDEYKIYVDKAVPSGEPPSFFYEKVEYVKNNRTRVSERKVKEYVVPEDKFFRGCPSNGTVCSSLDRRDCRIEHLSTHTKSTLTKSTPTKGALTKAAQSNVIMHGGQCMWCKDTPCDARSMRHIYVDQGAPPQFFYETIVEVTNARTRRPERQIREVVVSNDQMYRGCATDGYVCSSTDRKNCDLLMRDAQSYVVTEGGKCKLCSDAYCDEKSIHTIFVNQKIVPPQFFYYKNKEIMVDTKKLHSACSKSTYVMSTDGQKSVPMKDAQLYVIQKGEWCVLCDDLFCTKASEHCIFVDQNKRPPKFVYGVFDIKDDKYYDIEVPMDKLIQGCRRSGYVCSASDRKQCKAVYRTDAFSYVTQREGQCVWCSTPYCKLYDNIYVQMKPGRISEPLKLFYSVKEADGIVYANTVSAEKFTAGCPDNSYVCASYNREYCTRVYINSEDDRADQTPASNRNHGPSDRSRKQPMNGRPPKGPVNPGKPRKMKWQETEQKDKTPTKIRTEAEPQPEIEGLYSYLDGNGTPVTENATKAKKKEPLRTCYVILGVERDTDKKIIRTTFKKLAVKIHPDRNNGKTTAQFQEASVCNDILTDPLQRGQYDNCVDYYIPRKIKELIECNEAKW
ncbi:dnaJ domain-containing protein [Ditylenchus destructor]|nr:dnaJ domain-containing protein [Ditylenchus destructor]